MCGIAGFFDAAGAALRTADPEPLLQHMIGALVHRGPDARGVFVGAGAALAHARLSIVDLEGGRQPMSTPDGDVWVSFNGEIFNYVELRRELIERGHDLRTMSDTEVILHLYRERGSECVHAFNGDFAFALFDAKRKLLMLARDRIGVRPLYYTHHDGRLYFASEVKALLAVPGITAELDPFALDQIFTFWFPLAPRTPFKNIFELPPGHMLIATANGIQVQRYWQLQYPDRNDPAGWDTRGEGEVTAELSALLADATRIRLRADVPVGTYLSGGLDSSIVTAIACQFARERLRSFSVTFDSAEFDESAHQQDMVRALGTEHSSISCGRIDIAASFPTLIRHTERPILRTAPAPLLQLAKLVRQSRFKVVLTGEGADEVFGGYDIFKEAKLRRFCARQPESKRRPLLFKRLYPYLPQLQTQPRSYVQAFFTTGLDRAADPLFSHLPRFRTTGGTKIVFSRELKEAIKDYDAVAELRDGLPADFARWDSLCQAQYLEAAYLLPGYILSSQGDRVSMAHAVEGRFPFLDYRVVEFAARIPPRLKIRGLREKHILRESAKSLLPKDIVNRTKQPYRAPEAHSFFGAGVPSYVADRLSAREIKDGGCFDPAAVERLVNKCASGNPIGQRENMALIGILSTQLWREAFAQNTASAFKSAAA